MDQCAAEKKMYSLIDECNIILTVKSKLLSVLFSSIISLFSYCLEYLSSSERCVLKSPSIIVLWST